MKEVSTEARVLVAFLLSILVMAVWGLFYKPQPPPKPPDVRASLPSTKVPVPLAISGATVPPATPRAASEEKAIVVENDLYRVEFSNRGGVVRSWQLKKYTDDHKPPRTLDLVHPEAARQLDGWPFSLALEDPQLEARANAALFEVTPESPILRAPAELRFEWSDGHLRVTKRLSFRSSYVVEVETSVLLDGQPLAHALAWRGGFGDATADRSAEQVQVFFRSNGKIQLLPYKKLGAPDHPEQRLRQVGTMEYAGIEDRYFVAAFLPHGAAPEKTGAGLALWHSKLDREVVQEGKKLNEPVAEMAAGSTAPGPVALRVFVGPKDLDDLGKLNPPLNELVDFGWFTILALPLFEFLRWLHRYLPNYGWAIILMTVAINMVLFPLKVKSWRSMQKMQKVMPEIKSIQDRYKKYSMRDPRKQEMQQEIMRVYKREGINPMGGCLPMALQMPIWIALYRMLNVTIELRHARWFGWIRDLSAHDPYYILPVLMTVTMYVMQKMTPSTSPDPSQQRMMTLMPIMFGGMFIIYPVSSGLVLYILASNLVGMAQQWYLNRSAPIRVKGAGGRKK